MVTSSFVLRGRRGTISHPAVVLRGRRGTYGTVRRAWLPLVAGDAAALCVAGVALGDIHLRFTWQAWRNLTSTFVLRGRRGTYGTGWRAWSPLGRRVTPAALCVAGVALGDIHLRFTWQAWHNLDTSTFVLRGRRGTYGTAWRAWSPLVVTVTPSLAHTICHPPSLSHTIFHTQLLSYYHLSHTALSHTIFVTQPLSHTIFVTHNFVTHHL